MLAVVKTASYSILGHMIMQGAVKSTELLICSNLLLNLQNETVPPIFTCILHFRTAVCTVLHMYICDQSLKLSV